MIRLIAGMAALSIAWNAFSQTLSSDPSLDNTDLSQISKLATRIKSTTYCGEILSIPATPPALYRDPLSLASPGPQFIKFKRQLPSWRRQQQNEISYHTPEAQIFILESEAATWEKKNVKAYLRGVLAAELRQRAHAKFAREAGVFMDLGPGPYLHEVSKMTDELFAEDPMHPGRNIQLLMSVYPDLRTDIVDNATDPLRAFLCHYEHSQHKKKVLLAWSHVLTVTAIGLGVTTIVAGSQGVAVPALVVTAGVAAVAVGVRDIGLGLNRLWYKERAAKVAHRYKVMLRAMQKTIQGLSVKQQNSTLTSQEESLLLKLRQIDQAFTPHRRKCLKKLARAKHYNRMLIAFGILNAGFNGINLSGDATLLAQLPELILEGLHIM